MKVRAILFDMDGVLVDATDWHFEALNKALELFGMPISRAEHLTTYDGLPTIKKLKMLTENYGLPKELHDFLSEIKQQYTMDLITIKCKPKFIHEYALSNLDAMGYKLAVCSNSVKETVDSMMKKSNLDRYIQLKLSNEDVTNPKPDPEVYLKAMAIFGVKPEECLIVEDNENGIKAAKLSGGHVMIVKDIYETNLQNILSNIAEIELGG